ncbi:hypothetical protein [Streptomyces sp. NPDC127092]|uniref:hypothetical protein n=1 Tax=Streptomyces sp. NPDC127092 TaxID=3347135 RepID=UPI00364D93A3
MEGWHRVTLAIHRECGSYGSRLHQADDGTWVAYARWPDAETRERCAVPDSEGEAMMREAIAEYFPETRLRIADDLLAEPASEAPATGGPAGGGPAGGDRDGVGADADVDADVDAV